MRINKQSSRNAILKHAVRSSMFETLEGRVHLSATVESVDGSGNNLTNLTWGQAGTDLIRLTAAAYSDGISSPALSADQSARAISNILNNQADPNNPTEDLQTLDGNNLSDFGYAFGQFMDHDMDLTPDGGAEFDIAVAADDPIGPSALPFTRSITDPTTGTSASNPAQQITTVTAYFDLSQVYGSSQVVADSLRVFQHGLMKTSPGNMLPYDNTTYFSTAQIAALNMANDAQAAPTSALFATGDRRGNENIELTALQTLFVRNHNRIAGQLQKDHPAWTDEQIYQEARKLNIAEYQNIVFNGWIPAVLGQNALPAYRGYQASVNASISNEFSTVAFRFGHSLLSAEIERQNNDATDIADVSPEGSTISLAEDFFDPYLLNPTGAVDPLTGHTSSDIGAVLKAESDGVSQATDLMAVGDVRNLLFGNGGLGGEDLMARDVQRDRDNGIEDYNTLRISLGLPAITSFSQISSDPTVQNELAQAYPGGVSTIDAFEGGLAEDHVAGSDVGPLFQKIMVDQFTRLRDGDRFYFQNESFNPEERGILQQETSLTQVIEGSTNITNLQANAFIFQASIGGTVNVANGPNQSAAAVTVQLTDTAGNVLGTTTTDRNGHYSFDQQTGIADTGSYVVSLVLGSANTLLSPAPGTITITRGDTHVMNVNFAIGSTVHTPPPPMRTPAPPPPPRPGPNQPNGPRNNFASNADQLLQLATGSGLQPRM